MLKQPKLTMNTAITMAKATASMAMKATELRAMAQKLTAKKTTLLNPRRTTGVSLPPQLRPKLLR